MTAWLAALRGPSVTNQPPTDRELRRSDWAVVVLIVFSLFLGIGIRNNAANASRSVNLGDGLPTINVPTNWMIGTPEGTTIFQARNPRSGSTFASELSIVSRPVDATSNIVTIRTGLGAQRTRDLVRYRELSAQAVTVNGQDGILVTYAYVADPTREQGAIAPPVVVQGQDLIFPVGNQILLVTMAADAAKWDTQEQFFRIVTNSLRMREKPVQAVAAPLTSGEGGR